MPDYPAAFAVYSDAANTIFGDAPTLDLLYENKSYPFAHEAGVFVQENDTLFITSNQFTHPGSGKRHIQITKVALPTAANGMTTTCEEIEPETVPMANGGVNYKNGILFCAQGTLDAPGGIAYMDAHPPYASHLLVSAFHDRPFNSVNDVVVHSDGSIWFTDPIYGFEQGIRPKPRLPSQVYRYDPSTGGIRVVADGFKRPNGICFAPGEAVVYVTDTDWIHGDGSTDDQRVSTIYAFDVATYSNEPFLVNRRLFAMADKGVPDGIKCDVHGNVYSGCGDGVSVWSPGGVLLGKILVDDGVANFCFGRNGELFLLNEHRLWRAKISSGCKGALLGL